MECSNLEANFGVILTYCIKDSDSNKIYSSSVTRDEMIGGNLDKSVVKNCIRDMMLFDKIVTFYGARFDLPFLRTRALVHKIKFPGYGEQRHIDVYFIARGKLRLNSNRLEVVARTILGETQKTKIEYKHWLRGTQGNKRSLAYILDHNKRDVLDLEKVYNVLIGFKRQTNTSI